MIFFLLSYCSVWSTYNKKKASDLKILFIWPVLVEGILVICGHKAFKYKLMHNKEEWMGRKALNNYIMIIYSQYKIQGKSENKGDVMESLNGAHSLFFSWKYEI